jgi:hypothetical protein
MSDNINTDDDEEYVDPGRWHWRVTLIARNEHQRTAFLRANNLIEVHDACSICFGRDVQVLSVKRLGMTITAVGARMNRDYGEYYS